MSREQHVRLNEQQICALMGFSSVDKMQPGSAPGPAFYQPLTYLTTLIDIPDKLGLPAIASTPEHSLFLSRHDQQIICYIMKALISANDLFDGDIQSAATWLSTGKRHLGNEAPLVLLMNEGGLQRVIAYIHKIEHGVIC